MESDTPRTDAEEVVYCEDEMCVPSSFARQLERDLAAAIKQRNEANAHLRDACDEIARFRYEHSMIPISRLAEVVAEKRGWDCFEKEGGGA